VHSEATQHLDSGFETDGLALLPDCQRSEKDGDNAILSERNSVLGVAANLEHEMPVAPLIQQLAAPQAAHWKSAEHEWARRGAEALRTLCSLEPDQFDTVGLVEPVLRDAQLGMSSTGASPDFDRQIRRLTE
jgi:hypothetical protein